MRGPIFNFLSFFDVKLDLYLFALKDKIYDTFLVDVGININEYYRLCYGNEDRVRNYLSNFKTTTI